MDKKINQKTGEFSRKPDTGAGFYTKNVENGLVSTAADVVNCVKSSENSSHSDNTAINTGKTAEISSSLAKESSNNEKISISTLTDCSSEESPKTDKNPTNDSKNHGLEGDFNALRTDSLGVSANIAKNGDEASEFVENSGINSEISDTPRDFFTENSLLALKQRYPEINSEGLKENKRFNTFLTLIGSNPSLLDAFECYQAIESAAQESAMQKMARALANADTGVGALSSKEPPTAAYFTKEQVLKMSKEQIRRNYAKIRESQQKW